MKKVHIISVFLLLVSLALLYYLWWYEPEIIEKVVSEQKFKEMLEKYDPSSVLSTCLQKRKPPSVLFDDDILYGVGSKLLALAGTQEGAFLVAVNKMPGEHQEVALLAISSPPHSLPQDSAVFFKNYKLLFYERNSATNFLSMKKLIPLTEFSDRLALDEIFVKVIKSPYYDVPYLISVIAWGSPAGLWAIQKGDCVRGVAGVCLVSLQADYSIINSIYFEEFHTIIQGTTDGKQNVIWPQRFPQQNWDYSYYDFDYDGIPERIVIPIYGECQLGQSLPYQIAVLKWTKPGFKMLDPLEEKWPSRDLFVEFQKTNRDLQDLESFFYSLKFLQCGPSSK